MVPNDEDDPVDIKKCDLALWDIDQAIKRLKSLVKEHPYNFAAEGFWIIGMIRDLENILKDIKTPPPQTTQQKVA
tara:strand:- start:10770 stop:10994 length:225 start_codon:yes stop_codon:yes gene_type:complete